MSQRNRQFKLVMEHSKGFEAAAERARELLPEVVARRSPFESMREAPPVADDRVFEAVLRGNTESLPSAEDQRLGAALEAIILADLRPPYLIENDEIVIAGNYDRIELLETHKAALEARCRNVGRVDLVDHRLEYAGTGWLIEKTVVVTNRHVAEVFARPDWPSGWTFAEGRFGRDVEVRIDPYHQHNTRAARGRPRLTVLEILHVAGPREPDIAFLLVDPDHGLEPIPLKTGIVERETPIAAVGYPAADPERNNAMLMDDLFDGIYNVKRFSPGLATGYEHGNILLLSDYTTLGGNSGSAVLEIETGEAVGLHFAGLFQDTNYAVSADIVAAALRNLRTAMPGTMLDEPPTEVTPAAEFATRGGYDPDFLGGGEFRVDLPGLGEHAADVAPVEGSDDGVLRYTHFSVIQSKSRRLPRLTAVNIDGAKAFKLKRQGSWRTDGRLASEHQIDNVLYKNNPLDRGHMVRRKDPGWGDRRDEAEQAERDTFHYTNSAPQHRDLNQKDWVGLEDYILEAADTQDFKVSVMTGPIFRDDDRRLREQDGAEDIPIPGAFWKVAVMVDAHTKKLSATGYILTQGDMIRDLTETAFVYGEYKTYQVKLSKIAELTGLDFGTLAEHDPLRLEPEGVFGQAAFRVIGPQSIRLSLVGPQSIRLSLESTRLSSARSGSPIEFEDLYDRQYLDVALDLANALQHAQRKAALRRMDLALGAKSALAIFSDGETAVAALTDAADMARMLAAFDATPREVGGVTAPTSVVAAYAALRDELAEFLTNATTPKRWLVGHGLGAAVADLAAREHPEALAQGGLCTFGAMRTTLDGASDDAPHSGRNLHFVTVGDIVARMPPGFRPVGAPVALGPGALEPALTPEEFAEAQRRVSRLVRVTESPSALVEGAAATTSHEPVALDGLHAGFSEHRLDNYVTGLSRLLSAASPPSERSGLEGLTSRLAHATAAGSSQDGRTFGGLESVGSRGSEEPIVPALLQVSSASWSPPPDVRVQSQVGSFRTVMVPLSQLDPLRKDPAVQHVEVSREAGILELDTSIAFTGGAAVQRPPIDERGDAALVGIIDTGIDILHDAFSDGSGGTRIIGIWDQAATAGPTPHEVHAEFSQNYGRLYTGDDIRNYIDAFRASGTQPPRILRDPLLHGTHVASIAAGGRFGDTGPGMAPEAGIVVVIAHMRTEQGGPTSLGYSMSHVDALAFIKAVSAGGNPLVAERRPVAINMSLGMNAGAHDGKTTLEAAVDGITEGGRLPGCVIIKSAGNERGHAGHARVTAAANVVEIAWDANPRGYWHANQRWSDYFEVWFQAFDDLAFELIAPGGERTAQVNRTAPETSMAAGGARCTLTLVNRHRDNGDNLLAIEIVRDTGFIPAGRWRLEIVGERIRSDTGRVDIWVERFDGRAVRFVTPDEDATLSIPGTAASVICVAACNTETPARLTENSSYGRTRTNGKKPDIAAPGFEIVAAHANQPNTDAARAETGTSMAAPHVTGAVALALSRRAKTDPAEQLNANQIGTELRITARDFVSVHSPGYGYGLLDVAAFMDALR